MTPPRSLASPRENLASCPFCEGAGSCGRCGGDGERTTRTRIGTIRYRECRACSGTGWCELCEGSGELVVALRGEPSSTEIPKDSFDATPDTLAPTGHVADPRVAIVLGRIGEISTRLSDLADDLAHFRASIGLVDEIEPSVREWIRAVEPTLDEYELLDNRETG